MSKEHQDLLIIKIKGNDLKRRRKKKGLTREALAKKLGVSKSAVKQWEIDLGISERNLGNLCQILKCYPEDISIVKESKRGTKKRERKEKVSLETIKCANCPDKGTAKCHERYCEVMLCWMIFCAAILPNDYKPKLAKFLGLGEGHIPSQNEIRYGRMQSIT